MSLFNLDIKGATYFRWTTGDDISSILAQTDSHMVVIHNLTGNSYYIRDTTFGSSGYSDSLFDLGGTDLLMNNNQRALFLYSTKDQFWYQVTIPYS